jgi:sec-independent protein translocase protein TatA
MFTGLESPTHLLLLLLIILLLFGAKRLPEVGRILGQGIKEFKEGLNSHKEVLEKNQKEKRPEDIDRVAEIVPAAPGGSRGSTCAYSRFEHRLDKPRRYPSSGRR